MPITKRRAEQYARGSVIRARQLNQLSDFVNDAAGVNAPRDVDPDLSSVETQPIRVVIISVDADTLYCQDPDFGQDAEERATYQVAKPYMLRGSLSAHDGATFSYLGTNSRQANKAGEDPETQTITPRYVAGDELFIAAVPDSGIRNYPNVGDTVDYIDLNVDGRMWAVEASE